MKKIIILLICLLLSGCNYIELNDMGIVSLVAIQYQDNNYHVIIEIDDNKKNEEKSSVYEASGNSIEKAIEEVSLKVNKELYFIDLNVILIDQNTINQKFTSIIDYLTREVMFGSNFNILVDDNPKDTINAITKNDKIAGEYIKNIFNSSQNDIINNKYYDLLRDFLNPNIDIILPYGSLNNDSYIIDKAVIFNKEKIVSTINIDMIKIYNLLSNNTSNYLFKIKYQDKDLVYRVSKHKSKITYDNKIIVDLGITGSFIEIESIDLENKENAKEIISILEKQIKDEINTFLNKTISLDSDLLKFKKAYLNKTRKEIKSIHNMNYQININLNLDREGLIFDSIGDVYEKNK